MVCNWHLQDTRCGKNPSSVKIHTLVININKYEFCMIDYTVNALDGYKHQWTKENIDKALKFLTPYLKAMGVRGKHAVYGVEFPKTFIRV